MIQLLLNKLFNLKLVKWCCCTDSAYNNHDSICGGCKKYTYKLIKIVKIK